MIHELIVEGKFRGIFFFFFLVSYIFSFLFVPFHLMVFFHRKAIAKRKKKGGFGTYM